MRITVNTAQLERGNVHLAGEISPPDLDILEVDELVAAAGPVEYDFQAELLSASIHLLGRLKLKLDCHCSRCLKPYSSELFLDPWEAHLPLEGEEGIVIAGNEAVDLTPWIREDILLAFPRRPLCEPECNGLRQAGGLEGSGSGHPGQVSSPWAELNKIKFGR